jgi:phosphatidate cytidylyltransferase
MSRERIGLIVGAITLSSILLPLWAFSLMVALLSFLIAREVGKALDIEEVAPWTPIITLTHSFAGMLSIPLIGILSLIQGYRRWDLRPFSNSFLLLTYSGLMPAFLIDIKRQGTEEIFLLLITVWAIDVSAYYIGRRFGSVPLFPKISPKKTLEGYLGAGVVSFLLLAAISHLGILKSLIVAFSVLLAGAVGDYFKSFIKRQVGIKDFANTLGEHGGFTDRFDSLVFSAPVYLYIISKF